jgi:two-component system, NarL family, response regulator LiaR
MPIKILIVDDHSVIREGLRMFLSIDGELEIMGEAGNALEAITLAKQLRPDVIVMDLLMPGMDGIAAISALRKELPDSEIVALTDVIEDSSVVAAIKAGAIGYLLKNTQAEELRKAIKLAAAGQVYLSPQAATRLMQDLRNPEPTQDFTGRELDVLKLLAQGKANKEIAHVLNLGEKTIKTHVSNILAKLGVQSRTQAALYAVRSGLVPSESFYPKE